MKKFLVVVIMFASLCSFAQFEPLEAKITRISSVEGAHIELESKSRYDFSFRNMLSSSNEFVKFSFRGPKTADFDGIKNHIISNFELAVTDEIMKFKSNGEVVALKYVDQNGVKVVSIMTYKNGAMQSSRTFTVEEITLLFTK